MNSKVETADVPQANDLTKVVQTVVAVSKGAQTYQDIAKTLRFTERQGRYYRRAAEIVGLVSNKANKAELTAQGRDFIARLGDGVDPMQLVKPYVLDLPLIREVFAQIDPDRPIGDEAILTALVEVSNFSKKNKTARRRLSTFVQWLKQLGLITTDEKTEKYLFSPTIPTLVHPAKKILDEYDVFRESMSPFVGKLIADKDGSDWDTPVAELFAAIDARKLPAWLKSENNQKVARLILNLSEKDDIDIDSLETATKEFREIPRSHERLLIERYRSLRGAADNLTKGGNLLEAAVETWLTKHSTAFKPHYLFPKLSKNCDFYLPDLAVAIECKFSKSPGTKHSGALKDLIEISKAKEAYKKLRLGLAVAGAAFAPGSDFWNTLQELQKAGHLDFIVGVNQLAKLTPAELREVTWNGKPLAISATAMESASESEWGRAVEGDELGITDSILWLKKYSAISYLNLESRLQTWMSQTPFAIQCLRLILGWSESKTEGFLKTVVPDGAGSWKTEVWDYDVISPVVRAIVQKLSPEEKTLVETFFVKEIQYSDFLHARDMGLSGWARNKKEVSELFIEQCKSVAPFPTTDECETVDLGAGVRVKSNFSCFTAPKTRVNVLCKFYGTSGSVLSDLVKTVEHLSKSKDKDSWILVTDGPGWLSRDKDLRRLLMIAKNTAFQVYTLKQWQSIAVPARARERRIL